MAVHRYWKCAFFRTGGGSNTSVAELELRSTPGGADETAAGGAISADQVYLGYAAANAVDNVGSSFWLAYLGNVQHWLVYDFGAGNEKEINEVAITSRSDGYWTETPVELHLQYSDDGVTWTGWKWLTAAAYTAAAQQRVFTAKTPTALYASKATALAVHDRGPGVNAAKATALVAHDRGPGVNVSKATVLVVYAVEPLAIVSITPNHGYDLGGTRVRIVHNGGQG